MGASKANQFSQDFKDLSTTANALAHPARIAIINELRRTSMMRSTDFSAWLKLHPTTIHHHLHKLKRANLIEMEYAVHHYTIRLISENLEDLQSFLRN
ncbi:MAG: helix-turn-helix transcriptional regulator [Flavobacteriia bacterium]|nr:helix-turn-helix transcriptional regulator [Flavobacteriia bacterium]